MERPIPMSPVKQNTSNHNLTLTEHDALNVLSPAFLSTMPLIGVQSLTIW